MLKRLFRVTALLLFPFLGALLIRFIYFTSKKRFHLPQDVAQEPYIIVCWHGDLLMEPFIYKKLLDRSKVKVVISEHFDGRLIARTIEYFGLGSIHGSSTRNGTRVLIQAIRLLKEGFDIGITPDGPKGPRHEVQDGAIVMAQKSESKVIVFGTVPSSYWQLGSWDRFTIPRPFGTLDLYASEPVDLQGMSLEASRRLLKTMLMQHTPETKGA